MKYFLKLLYILFPAVYSISQINDIRFTHLTLEDGLSQSDAKTIMQDYKGFMWIGTQDGLNLYDGYNFKVFYSNNKNKNSISDNTINVIYEDLDKNLWIGTNNGLNLFNRDFFDFKIIKNNKKDANSILSNNVTAILEDSKRNFWIGTDKGICLYDKKSNKFNTILSGNSLFIPLHKKKINVILEDKEKNIWVGTENYGLYVLSTKNNYFDRIYIKNNISINDIQTINDSILWIATNSGIYSVNIFNKKVKLKHLPGLNKHFVATKLLKDKAGDIWIGTDILGLAKFSPKKKSTIIYEKNPQDPVSLSYNSISSIYEDRSGTIWIGTDGGGINKFDREKQFFKHYKHIPNKNNTLNSNMIWSVFSEKNIIWVGTDQGLNKINKIDNKIESFTLTGKMISSTNKSIFSIKKDYNNNLWIGTNNGLYIFNEVKKTFIKYKCKSNICNSRVYYIFSDNKNNLWVGTKDGLLLIDLKKKKNYYFVHNDSIAESISANTIRAIVQDSKGNIWIGTDGGGLNKAIIGTNKKDIIFYSYKHEENNENSLNNNRILTLLVDNNDNIWIGTAGGGLNMFDTKKNKFYHYTTNNGLPNNFVYGILQDKEGNLWMSTNKGLTKFDIQKGNFTNYKESDGLQSNEFNSGAYYYNSSTGELFFGGINGLNSFFPDDIKINTKPPQIVFTDFKIFNHSVPIGKNSILKKHISQTKELIIPYKKNVFSFEFAALHYSAPEKNEYAYKMEGFDEEWNYVGTQRFALYTNLDPGEYTFKVKASSCDGIWGKEESIKIIIPPPIWMTWWFRALVVIFIILSIAAYYINRIKKIKAQKIYLEQQVLKRTKEVSQQKEELERKSKLLEEEKEKTEHLLLNILPGETVEELKSKGKASARHYSLASVMFADFKSFTKIAENLRPKELILILDTFFIKFDEIIEKYNIEKIKTIGDSYMCVGGIPIRNRSNPIEITLAALEIQEYMKTVNKNKEKFKNFNWELRIGIHTGELIAGVIGIKRFAYDVWGDTVNIAERMEASGTVNKVNVSGSTYEHIKDFFVCEYRGKIAAKNKGLIDMYYVHKIKDELSLDGKGIKPNQQFWDYLNLKLYSKINYSKAEKFILKTLKNSLPPNLYYHSIEHTKDVVEAVERLAHMEGIKGEELYLLKTAALLHDAGFVKQYNNNEEFGAKMAEEILPEYGYTKKQIETIKNLILSTKVPHKVSHKLEKIICDADLDYLGRTDFFKISDKLKKELLERNIVKNDIEWDELQIKFFKMHKYHTKSAIKLRQKGKEKHLKEIIARLEKLKKQKSNFEK